MKRGSILLICLCILCLLAGCQETAGPQIDTPSPGIEEAPPSPVVQNTTPPPTQSPAPEPSVTLSADILAALKESPDYPGVYLYEGTQGGGRRIVACRPVNGEMVLLGGYQEYPANNFSGLIGPDGVEEHIFASPSAVYAMFESLLVSACLEQDGDWMPGGSFVNLHEDIGYGNFCITPTGSLCAYSYEENQALVLPFAYTDYDVLWKDLDGDGVREAVFYLSTASGQHREPALYDTMVAGKQTADGWQYTSLNLNSLTLPGFDNVSVMPMNGNLLVYVDRKPVSVTPYRTLSGDGEYYLSVCDQTFTDSGVEAVVSVVDSASGLPCGAFFYQAKVNYAADDGLGLELSGVSKLQAGSYSDSCDAQFFAAFSEGYLYFRGGERFGPVLGMTDIRAFECEITDVWSENGAVWAQISSYTKEPSEYRICVLRWSEQLQSWELAEQRWNYDIDPVKEPILDESVQTMAVPGFLTEEQQMLYRRAYQLYQDMFGGDTAWIDTKWQISSDEFPTKIVRVNGQPYTLAQGRYFRWADFDAVIHSVFTDRYWDGRNGADEYDLYIDYNGRLAFIWASKGSGWNYNPYFEDEFELVSRSEDEIIFHVIGHFNDEPTADDDIEAWRDSLRSGYDFIVRLPIRMVRTEDGWRVDEFYDAEDDYYKFETEYVKTDPVAAATEFVQARQVIPRDYLRYLNGEQARLAEEYNEQTKVACLSSGGLAINVVNRLGKMNPGYHTFYHQDNSYYELIGKVSPLFRYRDYKAVIQPDPVLLQAVESKADGYRILDDEIAYFIESMSYWDGETSYEGYLDLVDALLAALEQEPQTAVPSRDPELRNLILTRQRVRESHLARVDGETAALLRQYNEQTDLLKDAYTRNFKGWFDYFHDVDGEVCDYSGSRFHNQFLERLSHIVLYRNYSQLSYSDPVVSVIAAFEGGGSASLWAGMYHDDFYVGDELARQVRDYLDLVDEILDSLDLTG